MAVGKRADHAKIDALAGEADDDGQMRRRGARPCTLESRAQIRRDLVGQHFLQAETEQVRSIAAVRSRRDVAARSGGAAWTSVAGSAAVGQAGADRCIVADVAG